MNDNYRTVSAEMKRAGVTLVAVSKTKTISAIREMYDAGQRDFGENRVQELLDKATQLPDAIQWHLIGHLQKNKVKYIAPFVHLIHSVDSLELLIEIDKQAAKQNRIIPCLLQVHIASEESKFGMDAETIKRLLSAESFHSLQHIRIDGLMGMATFTDDQKIIRSEFSELRNLYNLLKGEFFSDKTHFAIKSMGMSSDYQIAIEEGSNMVRIGTLLFGTR